MKTYKPKTIDEAIKDLQTFFESDLPSHFFDTEFQGHIYPRLDKMKTEKEIIEYLSQHFNILKKQVKRLQREQKK